MIIYTQEQVNSLIAETVNQAIKKRCDSCPFRISPETQEHMIRHNAKAVNMVMNAMLPKVNFGG